MVRPRIVFMGTPAYAVPSLRVVAESGAEVLVVTRPDAARGRHRRLMPSDVARQAGELALPVLKTSSLRAGSPTSAALREFHPDLLVTAAYGVILPEDVLQLPTRAAEGGVGAVNLHASLLPRWRGANPIAWAIRAGDSTTGVTLMQMDPGIDTGPVLAAAEVAIAPDDTTGSLSAKLADVAATLLRDSLPALLEGRLVAVPQPQEGVTLAPRFGAADHRLVVSQQSADTLERLIASMLPEPGPYTTVDGVRVKILKASVVDAVSAAPGRPGQITLRGDEWEIRCKEGSLLVWEIQPAGKRPMSPGAYSRGLRRVPREVEEPAD